MKFLQSDKDRLRAMLAQLNISQREAARRLEISDRELRYMCAGTRPVPRLIFLALEKLIEETEE